MRDVDADLPTAVDVALLAQLQFDSGTTYIWSGIGPLTWDGNEYQGAGGLVGISTVEETQELQAKGLQVSLSGIPGEYISLALNEQSRGRKFRMWLANVVNNVVVGTPYRLFTGMMDVMSLSDNGTTGTLSLNVENSLIIGQRNKVRRYTSEDQKKEYPGDTGLDRINALQDAEVVW